MGADEVIAVDLGAIGVKKKYKNKDIKVTYITPHNDIGSFLVFDKKNSRNAIKFGYNDTMKVFNKLDGNKFTFKKGDLFINYTRIFNSYIENTRKIVKKIESKYIILDNIITPNSLNKLAISKDFSYINKTLLNSLEYAGQQIGRAHV